MYWLQLQCVYDVKKNADDLETVDLFSQSRVILSETFINSKL